MVRLHCSAPTFTTSLGGRQHSREAGDPPHLCLQQARRLLRKLLTRAGVSYMWPVPMRDSEREGDPQWKLELGGRGREKGEWKGAKAELGHKTWTEKKPRGLGVRETMENSQEDGPHQHGGG